ncbi:MAG: hypothetical protein KJ709_00870 [Nanoarchaeota archaeon]|nr:hypothetical protein [Nanoarchaeota archaeon]
MELSEIEDWYEEAKTTAMEKFVKVVNAHRDELIGANTSESFKNKNPEAEAADILQVESRFKSAFLKEMADIKKKYREMQDHYEGGVVKAGKKKAFKSKTIGRFTRYLKARKILKEQQAEEKKVIAEKKRIIKDIKVNIPRRIKRQKLSFKSYTLLKPVRRFYCHHLYQSVDYFVRPVKRRHQKNLALLDKTKQDTIKALKKLLENTIKLSKSTSAKLLVKLKKLLVLIGKGMAKLKAGIDRTKKTLHLVKKEEEEVEESLM